METRTIESRIEALERQNRLFRRASFAASILAVAVFAFAFRSVDEQPDAHFRIVTASKFSLVDARTGKPRAELSHQVVPGGWAGLTLWDADGKARAEFKLWEDGSVRMCAIGADGKYQSNISTSADGQSKLEIGGREIKAP